MIRKLEKSSQISIILTYNKNFEVLTAKIELKIQHHICSQWRLIFEYVHTKLVITGCIRSTNKIY